MIRLSRRALFALPVVLPAAALVPTVAKPKWRVYDEPSPAGWVMFRFDEPGPLKPYAIGRVHNMPASLDRPGDLIYQVSSEPLGAVYGVCDGGEPLASPVAWADHTTFASLRDASIKPGEYATCLREGLVRLGESPKRAVTADVYGIEWDAPRRISDKSNQPPEGEGER